MDRLPPEFRERALHEARRYGAGPWVFVRELIQNGRDAGASSVTLSVEEADARVRISCRDDGEGMSFDHARRFLFALYASSKEGRRGAAGRFGVGFWSVLRFEPTRLVVRSWPRGGEAWDVELDGALTRAVRRAPSSRGRHGTEVVLERPSSGTDVLHCVEEAARQSARFLGRRDDPARPLVVRVNGRGVGAAFDLPAPSASFRRRGLRGVVGLGREARVELFAQGLRVRSSACLEDLLAWDGRASDAVSVRFPEIADGLAPQALLDGQEVEVLLARADARDTPALRRLVSFAQKELAGLVEKQLAAARPEAWWRRGLDALGAGATRFAALAVFAVGAFAAGALWGGRASRPAPPPPTAPLGPRVAGVAAPVPGASPQTPRPYHDLLYPGPDVGGGGSSLAPLALRYAPLEARPRLAVLAVEPGQGATPPEAAGPYDGPACVADCLEIEVAVEGEPGLLRLPVPTGHRVDAGSVRRGGGAAADLLASNAGEPLLRLESRTPLVIRYRTGPGAPVGMPSRASGPFPEDWARRARALRERPVPERVAILTDAVGEAVAYSEAPDVAARHRAAASRGVAFASRVLEVGAGDCDLQNGLLALLLREADVPARVAIGYLGQDGAAAPWLHAWVEYRDGGGPWRVADASPPLLPPSPAVSEEPESAAATPPPAGRAERADRRLLAAGLGAAVFAAGLAAGLVRTRTRRVVRLDPAPDLVRLIRGVLGRPEAFAEVGAAFRRRLVPLLGGGALSIAEAWDRASRRRLFAARSGAPLARRAAGSGVPVLDTAREEARVVADALGAVDLGEWEAFLRAARASPLVRAAQAHLAREGEAWDLRLAPAVGAPAFLELPARALGPGFRSGRVLVVDESEPVVFRAEQLWQTRPAAALLALVDGLGDRLGLAGRRRARILEPLAVAALREAGR